MSAFAIGGQLCLVECDEGCIGRARHGLHGAAQIPRACGLDTLLTGNERDRLISLDRDEAVINLARKQAQRETDDAARMRAHPFDGEVGLAGIGGPEDRLDRGVFHQT